MSRASEPFAKLLIVHQSSQRRCQCLMIADGDENAGLAVADDFGHRTYGRCDDGVRVRHGLENGKR